MFPNPIVRSQTNILDVAASNLHSVGLFYGKQKKDTEVLFFLLIFIEGGALNF